MACQFQPHRPRKQLPTARADLAIQVTDDGSRTLVDPRRGISFHSGSGAVSETRHVYLEQSGIADRLRRGTSASVLEIGLGTSLAMLMTVDQAGMGSAPLRYHAVEVDWLGVEIMDQLQLDAWIDPELVCSYREFRAASDAQFGHSYTWEPRPGIRVTIDLLDARQWRAARLDVPAADRSGAFDAVYFDPFAMDVAPELWSVDVLSAMFQSVLPGGRLATYSCARSVREALATAGWTARIVPGPPGGKRNSLIAHRAEK